jgi:uncharacterized alkaline shock family protein YloU
VIVTIIANEHRNGTIKFSDEVIAVCSANATLKTKGVADLAGDFTNALSKSILGKELLSKGVKASQNDEGVIVDVFVIVEYKVNIPSVAWDIQENVKNEITSMTGLKVNAVNINIQGVKMPEEEAR